MATRAKLIGWGPRVLYLGPAFGLTPHRNATAVLAVALGATLEVADDPANPNGKYRSARSVLIPPNTLHHLRIAGAFSSEVETSALQENASNQESKGSMAFLYIDSLSADLAAIGARMHDVAPRAAFDLVDENAVIDVLTGLADGRTSMRVGRDALGGLLGLGAREKPDGRILSALQRMHDEPHKSHSLAELGDCAGLSTSRFLSVQGASRDHCVATEYGSHGRGGWGIQQR